MQVLSQRFDQVYWCPGNHDLWNDDTAQLKGEKKYHSLLEICHTLGVHHPESPFQTLILNKEAYCIAPTFTGYDYSFTPYPMSYTAALAWAKAGRHCSADEHRIDPQPYTSIIEWCQHRIAYTTQRLQTCKNPIVYLNHYPILAKHAKLPLIPRFSIWCGSKQTECFLEQFPIRYVVYGHLHIPQYRKEKGLHFFESSFGYPKQQRWYGSDMNDRLMHIGTIG